MMGRDPLGARDELEARILAKVAAVLGGEGLTATDIAAAVMDLFHSVDDEWERCDVTTLGETGESFIENRYLVCRAPVQGFGWSRPVDRTVT